jgi:hypothetical protein
MVLHTLCISRFHIKLAAEFRPGYSGAALRRRGVVCEINPSVFPFYWLVDRDSPIGLL